MTWAFSQLFAKRRDYSETLDYMESKRILSITGAKLPRSVSKNFNFFMFFFLHFLEWLIFDNLISKRNS